MYNDLEARIMGAELVASATAEAIKKLKAERDFANAAAEDIHRQYLEVLNERNAAKERAEKAEAERDVVIKACVKITECAHCPRTPDICLQCTVLEIKMNEIKKWATQEAAKRGKTHAR